MGEGPDRFICGAGLLNIWNEEGRPFSGNGGAGGCAGKDECSVCILFRRNAPEPGE